MKAKNINLALLFLTVLFIVITESCRTPLKPKAMDVVWSETDLNGFPKKPFWGQQIDKEPLPSPCKVCPTHSNNANDWTDSSNCTNYPVYSSYWGCFDPNSQCGNLGHINFMPVLYEGKGSWTGYNYSDPDVPANFDYYGYGDNGDGDFDMEVSRSDSALYLVLDTPNCDGVTKNISNVGVEFDTREFLPDVQNTDLWWGKLFETASTGIAAATKTADSAAAKIKELFPGNTLELMIRARVDSAAIAKIKGTNTTAAKQMFTDKPVIILGLLALDCFHNCYTELHPVYAMFVKISETPYDEFWAFFVRNWGDEGYQSDNSHSQDSNSLNSDKVDLRTPSNYSYENDLSFFIPCVDSVLPNTHWAIDANPVKKVQWDYSKQDNGMEFNFHLASPENQSWIVGDLHLSKNFGLSCNPSGLYPKPDRDSIILSYTFKDNDSNEIDDLRINKLDSYNKKELLLKLKELKPKIKTVQLSPDQFKKSEKLKNVRHKGGIVNFTNCISYRQDSSMIIYQKKREEIINAFLKEKGLN